MSTTDFQMVNKLAEKYDLSEGDLKEINGKRCKTSQSDCIKMLKSFLQCDTLTARVNEVYELIKQIKESNKGCACISMEQRLCYNCGYKSINELTLEKSGDDYFLVLQETRPVMTLIGYNDFFKIEDGKYIESVDRVRNEIYLTGDATIDKEVLKALLVLLYSNSV